MKSCRLVVNVVPCMITYALYLHCKYLCKHKINPFGLVMYSMHLEQLSGAFNYCDFFQVLNDLIKTLNI